MFDEIRLKRHRQYGMTTLILRGPDSELELKLVSRENLRERRAFVRSLLTQIRPWLEHFKKPIISHSPTGRVRIHPRGRSDIKVFDARPIETNGGAYGFQIRRQRNRLGLSQATLAAYIGIRRSHLSDIERGIHRPSAKTHLAISEALGLFPDPTNVGRKPDTLRA
jgi:DNA-binding XRE family transcriptional regulator